MTSMPSSGSFPSRCKYITTFSWLPALLQNCFLPQSLVADVLLNSINTFEYLFHFLFLSLFLICCYTLSPNRIIFSNFGINDTIASLQSPLPFVPSSLLIISTHPSSPCPVLLFLYSSTEHSLVN